MDYPILEFDDEQPFIKPGAVVQAVDIAEHCVMCYFSDAISLHLEKTPHRVITTLRSETIRLPVYQLEHKGRRVALVQAHVGAPAAAIQMEELMALGCRKFLACGSCGVLQKDLALGHLIIPTSAIRDEGTSYHYISPAREIEADIGIANKIASTLQTHSVPYIMAKTWTTDALYRETPGRIARRKAEGCVTVEMEASAYMAVARHHRVGFGQILYAGDNLGGEEWDKRSFNTQTGIRAYVLDLALDACVNI